MQLEVLHLFRLFRFVDARDFPLAWLHNEINARFVFNEHGNLYFYCIIIVYMLSSSIRKKWKNVIGRKRDVAESVHKTVTLGWRRKQRLDELFWSTSFLIVRFFPQILYDIVLYARHFRPIKLFPKYYFNKLAMFRATAKCNLHGPMYNARD